MKAFLIILASVFMILGILVLYGKGDWPFSPDDEYKKKYNIERLRLVWGVLLILAAVDFSLMYSILKIWGAVILSSLPLVEGILRKTWAKKKDSDL